VKHVEQVDDLLQQNDAQRLGPGGRVVESSMRIAIIGTDAQLRSIS